ncbi:MAG: hypothetical protein R6U32_03970 [Candidatus Woesearchaeota archaeon]
MKIKNIILLIPAILLFCIMLSSCSSQEIEISEDVKECIEEKSQGLVKQQILHDLRSGGSGILDWADVSFTNETSLAEAKEIMNSQGMKYSISEFPDRRHHFTVDLKESFPDRNDSELIEILCRLEINDMVASTDTLGIQGHKRFYFPTNRITIEANKSETKKFLVKNIGDSKMRFCVLMEYLKKKAPKGECDSFLKPTSSAYNDYCGGFHWDSRVKSLQPEDAKIMGLKYYAPPERNQTYLYRLTVLNAEDNKECPDTYDPDNRTSIYAQKSFFVQVR